jgi:hypothetical protein
MMTKQYCTTASNTITTNEKVKMTDETNVNSSNKINGIDEPSFAPLQFEVADARELPYPDNSFHMVLEKGALDAMLSDRDQGITHCVQIVSECARVTCGCIMIISHLNAHTPPGLEWLEEVVMEGLKKYSVRPTSDVTAWEIEVHGNADMVSGEEDEEEDKDETKGAAKSNSYPVGTTGPAVYVIHKIRKGMICTNESINVQSSPPTISQSPSKITNASTMRTKTSDTTIESLAVAADDDDDDDILDIVPINVRFFSY